jgi:uncharacterized protein (TIGR02145 family)
MQKKILGVAGCAALMFGLIACSGEDGKDGVNGTNGLNGTSCEVKSLKTGDGYKVLCGGDSVGVLLNGKKGTPGDQGKPGAQGKPGTNGTNGSSCYVEPITNGYDIYCGTGNDTKKVGQLKNGVAGESCTTEKATDGILVKCAGEDPVKISNGVSCEAKPYSKNGLDGLEILCGDADPVYLWNGTKGDKGDDCTANEFTDKDTGKKGFKVSCAGEVVGTVWNGDDGANCVSEDNGDGTVDVTCGDAKAVRIYKAMCGEESYDPEFKFCVLGKLYDKCDGKTFTVNREYCNDGVVATLCNEVKFDKKGKPTKIVGFRGTTKKEFCWNGIITKKCAGEEFGVNQYCGKTMDGKADSVWTYCDEDKMAQLQTAYNNIGIDPLASSSSTGGVSSSSSAGFFGNLIGEKLVAYELGTVQEFYSKLEGLKETCTDDATVRCGLVVYNDKKEFCDERDETIYGYTIINNLKVMTENLAFVYKLPVVNTKKDDDGKIIEESLEITNSRLAFEEDAFENFDAGEGNGRYYTWNSAMGVGDLRKDLSENGELKDQKLVSIDTVFGACPEGWRLPSQSELEALKTMAAEAQEGFANLNDEQDPEKVINFNVQFLGYHDGTKVKELNKKAFFWSSDEIITGNDDKQAYGLVIKGADESDVTSNSKKFAFTIRCVQDTRN